MRLSPLTVTLLCPLMTATTFASDDPPWGGGSEVRISTVTDEGDVEYGRISHAKYRGPAPIAGDGGNQTIPQMPGFPVQIGSLSTFAPWRGVALADLSGDGNLEIITSSTDSKVYVWDYTGQPRAGFPVTTIGWAQNAPSVGDVTGDGHLEIVQTTRGSTGGGRLYVIDRNGNVLPGFPVDLDNSNLGHPTLFDLNGDGKLEIIVGQRAWPIGYLHIINHDGTSWGGKWPVELDHVPTGTAAVGDITDNGELEIFFLSYQSMYLLNLDGQTLPGWPQQINNANFSYQSAALADLDGDGRLEIVVGAHQSAAGTYIYKYDGTLLPGWPKLAGTWTFCPPTVTDLTGDGELEIINGRAGGFGGPSAAFWAWDTAGNVKPGFPYIAPTGGSEGPLTVADINGNGQMEIFADSNIMSDGQGYLFGVDAQGNDLPGFPLRPQGFTHLNSAAIADVNNDGTYELAVISRHEDTAWVNLYNLPDQYAMNGNEWPTYHLRNTRGGWFGADEPCHFADLNCDGTVDGADLGILLANWGPCDDCDDCPADLNGDCEVDGADLGILLANWG